MSRFRSDGAEAVLKILLRERVVRLPHVDLVLSQAELESAARQLANDGNQVWVDQSGAVVMGRGRSVSVETGKAAAL